MPDKLRDIQSWIGMIGETENRINDQKKETIKQISEIFLELAKIAKEFSEKGNLDEIPGLLEELQAAKEKVEWELQKLLKQIKSQAGQAGQELQNLATNLGGNTDDTTEQQDDTTEQQDDTTEQQDNPTEQQDNPTRLTTPPTEEKENFETNITKANKQKALEFLEKNITDQNTLELIKKKINEIEYTQRGIKIGNVEWARINASNNLKQASKSDFEQSFEWLFGEKLPDPTKNTKGELEYPRNEKIAVIPLLLGWERKGRYGQDGKWHLVWESGFYVFQGGRVCKFDETGGTIRPKRNADGKIETAYITW